MIAVVLPVHNVENYLIECLDSFKRQSCRKFNVVAIDDGSTDRSGQILDEYALENCWLQVFHKKNGGVSSARNLALNIIKKQQKFNWVSFVDSDDVVAPDFLSEMLSAISAYKCDYAICASKSFDKNGYIVSSNVEMPKLTIVSKIGMFENFFLNRLKISSKGDPTSRLYLGNKLFNLHAISNVYFNEGMKYGEDQDWAVRAFEELSKGVVVPRYLHYYRLRASSASHKDKKYALNADLRLYIQLRKTMNGNEPIRKYMDKLIITTWWRFLRNSYKNISVDRKFLSAISNDIRCLNLQNLDVKMNIRLLAECYCEPLMWLYLHRIRRNEKKEKEIFSFFE